MKLYKKEKHWHLEIGKRHIKGPNVWDVLKCFVGLKSVIILLVLCSCGTPLKINGIQVKRTHQKKFTLKDFAEVAGCVVLGRYVAKNVINTSKQK